MSKYLFVINPVAGAKSHDSLVDEIKEHMPKSEDVHFEVWSKKERFAEIKNRILSESFDKIVACGGDGTISLISRLATKVNTPLGIIPLGSGNGYARHLKIPLKVSDAVDVILSENVLEVDTAEMDNHYYINIAGLGFDALVSEQFSKTKKRGIINYASLIFKNLFSYQPATYSLSFNNICWSGKAVVVDFALGTQYGNNAVISPHSDPSDGKIDICILEPYPFYYNFVLLYRFYTNSIHCSKYFKSFRAEKIEVDLHDSNLAQFDGEPFQASQNFTIEVNKEKLKIIVP